MKVEYAVISICAELLNHDFAAKLLSDKVTGPLLIECVCISVNNYVCLYINTFLL